MSPSARNPSKPPDLALVTLVAGGLSACECMGGVPDQGRSAAATGAVYAMANAIAENRVVVYRRWGQRHPGRRHR